MDSRRQLKVGSEIQKAFAEILTRDGKALTGKAFVTLTKAKATSDLSLVRFYLSVFNSEQPDEIIDKFNEHKFELKRKLAEKLRHQLRVMPEIEFFRDETLDYAFHMEEVFKKVHEDDERIKTEASSTKKEVKPTIKKAVARKKK
jgi:ribosome-binding factor A